MKYMYNQMFNYYHGQVPNCPSHIEISRDGSTAYRDLYDSFQTTLPRKSIDKSSTPVLILVINSQSLADVNVNYHSRHEIIAYGLGEKPVNATLLLTGQSLHGIATKKKKSNPLLPSMIVRYQKMGYKNQTQGLCYQFGRCDWFFKGRCTRIRMRSE